MIRFKTEQGADLNWKTKNYRADSAEITLLKAVQMANMELWQRMAGIIFELKRD